MKDARIGLALSGGGSRAIAFHLGCLRALNKLGIMNDVKVVSTVSGGSVVGGLYAAHQGTFPEFESLVRKLLVRGFVKPALRKAFTTSEGLRAFWCWILLLVLNTVFFTPMRIACKILVFVPVDRRTQFQTKYLGAPVRRFASIATILGQVFEDVFQEKCFRDLPTNGPLLIVNAADLRTGSAFYFSQQHSGSWRHGTLACPAVSLGYAVTASAAYPAFLPALDEVFWFEKDTGMRQKERVTLTDGGVYDNLALAPLWPDRDPEISLNVASIDNIICCRAGYGARLDPPSQFLLSRLKGAFTTIQGRAQNVAVKRLFDLKQSGKLKGVILPYLGQNDVRLKHPPSDLVTQEHVQSYPTNFFAMSEEWIEKLSLRGEQLTIALIKEHHPELLSERSAGNRH